MSPFASLHQWLLEPFTNGFMQSALLAGLLAVVATSVVGTWVVLRGMSFLGDALAHGVLPGIAIAFILGVNTTLGALVAALLMILSVSAIKSHSSLPEDVSIGVLFVGFLALAVVIMSSSSVAYFGDLNRFLFGSITAVDEADLWRQAIAALLTLIVTVVFYRAFLVMTFDETQARLLGLRPRLAHMILLILLVVSIVSSFEAVGNLLVFAFLVAPPATATLVARRVPVIMTVAVGIGSFSVVSGLLISFHQATAPAATMALCTVAIFMATLTLKSIASRIGDVAAISP